MPSENLQFYISHLYFTNAAHQATADASNKYV